MKNLLDQLEVFYGDTNECVASVYARLMIATNATDYSLNGQIKGPNNAFGQTLSSTTSLSDLGPGLSVLAKASVPDPCFWSPESPALYELAVELRHGGQVVEATSREFGIRMFGRRDRDLFSNSRRWVCRGVLKRGPQDFDDLSQYRENSMVIVREQPEDSLCKATSRQGVMLVPLLCGDEKQILRDLKRVARWGSVGMAMIRPSGTVDGDKLLSTALNILLVEVNTSPEPIKPADWASAIFGFRLAPEACGRQATKCHLPVLAFRRYDGSGGACVDTRRECERLQADLAVHGNFSGYIIG